MAKAITVFLCPSCSSVYYSTTAATGCHAKPCYYCQLCGRVHHDRLSASRCCENDVQANYMCGACRKVHSTKQAAENCHPNLKGSWQ